MYDMNKEERINLALTYYHNRYNCTQAVLCAYSDDLKLDHNFLCRLGIGFGSGIGASFKGTCGAINGAVMVLDLLNQELPEKRIAYANAKKITEEFIKRNSTITCGVLKGIEGGKVLRSCDGCISDAIDILEEILHSND